MIGRRATLCSRLLILESGYVLLHQPDGRDDAPAYLLGPGDPLGEECLQPGAEWNSHATAVTPLRAVAFDGIRIARICRQFPGLAAYVLVRLQRRRAVCAALAAKLRDDCETNRLLAFMHLVGERFGRPAETPSRKYLPVSEDELRELLDVSEAALEKTITEREEQGLAGRGERRSVWVNILSSSALAFILAARTITGPAAPALVEGEMVLVPARGRRGRALKAPERHRLAVLSAGSYRWPITEAG